MRILYFHQHFSTTKGSSSTRSYEFAKKLISRGHQVTMVCGSYWLANSGLKSNFKNGYRQGIVDGINVIEFKLSYSNSDGFLKRSLTFIRFSLMSLFIDDIGKMFLSDFLVHRMVRLWYDHLKQGKGNGHSLSSMLMIMFF